MNTYVEQKQKAGNAALQAALVSTFIISTLFALNTYLWLISSCTIILITYFWRWRNWILMISPIFIVTFLAGNLKSGSTGYIQNTETLTINIQILLILVFLLFILLTYFFQKFCKRYQISLLLLTSILLFFIQMQIETELIKLSLRIFIFFLAHQFLNIIINSDSKSVTLQETIMNSFQIWTVTTTLPIPLPLLRSNTVSKDSLLTVQWKGLKILFITMLTALGYNLICHLLAKGNLDFSKYDFNYIKNSAFHGLDNIVLHVPGVTGYWLGVLFIGLGVFVKITVSMGYTVALLRMAGFDMPANINQKVFKFNNFKELLRSFYFYYSYLLTKTILPRINRFLKTCLPKCLSLKLRFKITIISTLIIGGLILQFTKTGLPILLNKGFSLFLQQILFSGSIFAIIGIIIAFFFFDTPTEPGKSSLLRTTFIRLWLIMIFSLLISLKTSMTVQHWDLMQMRSFLIHLTFGQIE